MNASGSPWYSIFEFLVARWVSVNDHGVPYQQLQENWNGKIVCIFPCAELRWLKTRFLLPLMIIIDAWNCSRYEYYAGFNSIHTNNSIETPNIYQRVTLYVYSKFKSIIEPAVINICLPFIFSNSSTNYCNHNSHHNYLQLLHSRCTWLTIRAMIRIVIVYTSYIVSGWLYVHGDPKR